MYICIHAIINNDNNSTTTTAAAEQRAGSFIKQIKGTTAVVTRRTRGGGGKRKIQIGRNNVFSIMMINLFFFRGTRFEKDEKSIILIIRKGRVFIYFFFLFYS